ncbi:hypothetical protein [Streptomyces sp. NPDC054765]
MAAAHWITHSIRGRSVRGRGDREVIDTPGPTARFVPGAADPVVGSPGQQVSLFEVMAPKLA